MLMAVGAILDHSRDRIHLAPSKRKRSFDLEDFQETAVSQARRKQDGIQAPTPSPPSTVMPSISMYDIGNLDDSSPGPTPSKHSPSPPPPDFFRSYTTEPALSLSPLQNDDRLQETINTTARLSAASTMTIGESILADDSFDDSEDQESGEEEGQTRPPPATGPKKSAPKKPRARSRELAESSDKGAVEVEGVQPKKKSASKKPRAESRDLLELHEIEEVQPKKRLRQRTMAQEQPYQFDKVRHNMSKKSGYGGIDGSDVEQQLISTQRKAGKAQVKPKTSPKGRAKAKRARASIDRFSSVDTGRSTPTSTAGTPDVKADIELRTEQVLQNTTLNIWMKGDDDGANAIQLAQCPTVTALFDHIDDTWGKACGKQATRVKCTMPWKDKKANLVMYRGWDTSFEKLLQEIRKAPVWRKKGVKDLDIELVVTLE